jgi:hypothetical protein
MDKTIRKYTSFDKKADEYRYWQSRPVWERVAAVSELTEEGYRMKGMGPDAFRLQRTLVHFEPHRVKYLIVGAYAVAVYAQPRATKDLDILVKADAENARAIFAALAQFGAPLEGLTVADFAEPGPFFRMGREPVDVDFMTAIPGVEVDAAWPRRLEEVVDEAGNLRASFISREDLIAAKLASGRPRDLADVDEVRKATESQRPEGAKKTPGNETERAQPVAPHVSNGEQAPLEFFRPFPALPPLKS